MEVIFYEAAVSWMGRPPVPVE